MLTFEIDLQRCIWECGSESIHILEIAIGFCHIVNPLTLDEVRWSTHAGLVKELRMVADAKILGVAWLLGNLGLILRVFRTLRILGNFSTSTHKGPVSTPNIEAFSIDRGTSYKSIT